MQVRRILPWAGMGIATVTLAWLAFHPGRNSDAALAETSKIARVPEPKIAQVSKSTIRLADLTGKRDKAILHLTSDGCFSSSDYRLEYTPLPTPRVTVFINTWQSKTPRRLGAITLTRAQVNRLDETLRFFRQTPPGGCTTSETLDIKVFRNGIPTMREKNEDSTCNRNVLEEADPRDLQAFRHYKAGDWLAKDAVPILSFSRIIDLAHKANKQKRAAIPYPEIPRKYTAAHSAIRQAKEETAGQRRAEQMTRNLPGYAAMQRHFKVDEVIDGRPDVLYSTLSATTPRLVDAAQWEDRLQKNKPRYNWNDFLKTHQAVEKAVAPHIWLHQWKKAGPGRSVEAQIVGVTAMTEEDPTWKLYPVWKHAGLKGIPRYEVQLRGGSADHWLTIYFGDEDSHALVLQAEPSAKSKPGFWLDTLKLLYHPTQRIPEYVTITPDGTWKRNTRPDPETKARFALYIKQSIKR